METKWEINGEDLNIGISGRFDTMRAMALDDRFGTVPEEVKNIYFDFTGMEYIASAGLRILYWAEEYTQKKGGVMIVRNVSPEVDEILSITGIKEFITIE